MTVVEKAASPHSPHRSASHVTCVSPWGSSFLCWFWNNITSHICFTCTFKNRQDPTQWREGYFFTALEEGLILPGAPFLACGVFRGRWDRDLIPSWKNHRLWLYLNLRMSQRSAPKYSHFETCLQEGTGSHSCLYSGFWKCVPCEIFFLKV